MKGNKLTAIIGCSFERTVGGKTVRGAYRVSQVVELLCKELPRHRISGATLWASTGLWEGSKEASVTCMVVPQDADDVTNFFACMELVRVTLWQQAVLVVVEGCDTFLLQDKE